MRDMIKYLTVLLGMCHMAASGQTVYQYVTKMQESNAFYDRMQYDSALQIRLEALSQFKHAYGNFDDDYFYFRVACCYAGIGDTTRAFENLQLSLDKGMSIGWIERYTEILSSVLPSQKWAAMKSDAIAKRQRYGVIREQLSKMYKRDQLIRSSMGCLIDMFGADSDEVKTLKDWTSEQDSVHEQSVRKIISTYGWLGPNDLGKKYYNKLWTLVQHSSLELQESMLPLLKQAVHDGYIQGANYALMYDRIETIYDRPQLYGTQLRKLKDGGHEPFPILDVKNVDERRAQYGLEPLEQYYERFKVVRWNVKE